MSVAEVQALIDADLARLIATRREFYAAKKTDDPAKISEVEEVYAAGLVQIVLRRRELAVRALSEVMLMRTRY